MIAYLDCSSGISGDKFLAALLDIGEGTGEFTLETLAAAVEGLGVGEAALTASRVVRGGLSGLHLEVDVAGEPPHRSWADVRMLLERAPLPARARERGFEAFALIAQVEARAHGTDPEHVHFHEVGATDSIVDIVGVSLGLELLGIERLVCSTVAVGSGLTPRTAHGVLPAPAPATLELLLGVPVEAGAASGELTTPTGAALVRTNADAFGVLPAMTPVLIGYGAGSRELDGVPNVARLILGHVLEPAQEPLPLDGARERVTLLETAVDHISAEEIAATADRLRDLGALDAWTVPAAMKKGRLGVELRVLVRPDDATRIEQLVHEHTGSTGVRRTELTRSVLAREELVVEGPWGEFGVKVSGTGASRRVRPESDEVARISRETGRPYAEIARELESIAHGSLPRTPAE